MSDEDELPEDVVETLEESPEVDEDDPIAMLATLLEQDPELTRKIANLIEEHYGGGMMGGFGEVPTMPTMAPASGFGASAPTEATPVPGFGAPTPAAPTSGFGAPTATPTPGATGASLPPELLERLDRVEQSQADMAVQRELEEARQEYEAMKEQLPILPEMDDQELIQIALDKGGLPLQDALVLWAMQKMREGEGAISDRLMAALMEQSKAKGLPSVEGKGGMIPSGEVPQPQSLREARGLAKDRLRALFSNTPG